MDTLAGAVVNSFEALADRFQSVDPRFALAALLFQLGNLAFRALAWRNVLRAAYPEHRVPVTTIGAAYAAGVALNGFVPARGGEAAKIGLARAKLPGSSVATIAASSSVVLVLDAVVGGALLVAAWAFGVIPSLPGPQALAGPAQALASQPALVVPVALVTTAGGALAARALAGRLAGIRRDLGRGTAILRMPVRYLREVVVVQLCAWSCRIGVVFCLLAAFDLTATIPLAALVVVAGGLSTLAPVTPGGAGTQQAMVALALQGTASTSGAVSFSVGMQVGVTVVNTLIGLAALMLMFRTFQPVAAVRAGRGLAGRRDRR